MKPNLRVVPALGSVIPENAGLEIHLERVIYCAQLIELAMPDIQKVENGAAYTALNLLREQAEAAQAIVAAYSRVLPYPQP